METDKKEKIKDILKPIRQEANKATGNAKTIYSEMLRQIDERFPGGEVSRYELAMELERQRGENLEYIKDDKKWLQYLSS